MVGRHTKHSPASRGHSANGVGTNQAVASKKKKKTNPRSVIYIVLGMLVLLAPVGLTHYKNEEQHQIAERYSQEVSEMDTRERDAMLQSAREYNERLPEFGAPDPWVHGVDTQSPDYKDYRSQLDVNSVLDVKSSGERITDVTVNNAGADPDHPNAENGRSISFTVLPVTSAGDTSNGGSAWSVAAVNRFPSVDVEKTIDGSPIGAVGSALFDTVVLADDATSMHMTYKIKNNGGMNLSAFQIKDESLSGRTLTNAAGTKLTVGADGVIPADFCAINAVELQGGGEHTCSFDVAITEPKEEYFSYKGAVTVTATAAQGTVSDTDEFGAIRRQQALGWMLPDTGMQTLVLFILLGLLAVAYGVYRYLRTKDEDDEDELAEDWAEEAETDEN
ncbi:hypothetical protein ACUY3M_05430 [Corynebacterium suicordis]